MRKRKGRRQRAHQRRSTHPRDWMTRAARAMGCLPCHATCSFPSAPAVPDPKIPMAVPTPWAYQVMLSWGWHGLLFLVLVIGK